MSEITKDNSDVNIKPIEVERKFLVDPEKIPTDIPIERILKLKQAYIGIAQDGSETRVRQTEEDGESTFELTVKSKGDLVRGEETVQITKAMFKTLLEKHEGIVISKTRLTIPYDENTIELDIYDDVLGGLCVAEVEFDGISEAAAIDEANTFESPEWFGSDVTSDKNFKNQSLALNGLRNTNIV